MQSNMATLINRACTDGKALAAIAAVVKAFRVLNLWLFNRGLGLHNGWLALFSAAAMRASYTISPTDSFQVLTGCVFVMEYFVCHVHKTNITKMTYAVKYIIGIIFLFLSRNRDHFEFYGTFTLP